MKAREAPSPVLLQGHQQKSRSQQQRKHTLNLCQCQLLLSPLFSWNNALPGDEFIETHMVPGTQQISLVSVSRTSSPSTSHLRHLKRSLLTKPVGLWSKGPYRGTWGYLFKTYLFFFLIKKKLPSVTALFWITQLKILVCITQNYIFLYIYIS